MTSLLPNPAVVKSTRVLFDSAAPIRLPHFGGAKLFRSPSHGFEPNTEDRQWWAQECERIEAENAMFDRMAEEADALGRYERGVGTW